MDITGTVVGLLALLLGLALGWLLAARRGDIAGRALAAEAAQSRATLAAQRASASERELARARQDEGLREAFGALAGDALRANSEAFLGLAESRLAAVRVGADSALAQRQQAIEGLVGPLRESLDRVQSQLVAVERERTGSYSALLAQIATMRQTSEQLRAETAQLVTALRAPQVRGRWGELQLERTVEAAGLAEHIDYLTQATAAGEDGALRPDLVVRLVGGKSVVVDAKVPFSGYLEAMEARDEASRANRLKAHARQLREHIDSLAAKAYWERFAPSPEFVVCFIPADAFLDAALREDPALLEHAFVRDVVLATPSTLIALLRTVAYTWRQDALAANAAQVQQLGRELYQRLATMGGHIDKLGRALGTAVGSYNQAVSSLESRVLVSARRLADLNVVDGAQALDPPTQLTATARAVQAAEFAR
ncbi:MAG: DNA recombination protein RmuC [Actinomycetia bacterium]|nr:DNA recombination protein RmuC [Actinomycetes bacterium]